MSIAALKNLADNTWVNDPVSGTIHEAKGIKGDTLFVANMTYSGITIKLITEFHDLRKYEGKVVEINGSGIKKKTDDFKGVKTPKLSFGAKAVIKVLGNAATDESSSSSYSASPKASTSSSGASLGRFGEIPGPTVGMAINNAIGLLKEACPKGKLKDYCLDGSFSADVAKIAGSVVKISKFLEDGNLDGYSKLADANFTADDLPDDETPDEEDEDFPEF